MASKVDPELVADARKLPVTMPPIAMMSTPAVVRILDAEQRLVDQQDRSSPALEHLLRAIMMEPAGAKILQASGAQLETLELALASSGSRTHAGHAFLRDAAVEMAQLSAHDQQRDVTIADLLHGLLRDSKSSAVTLLGKHGARRVDVFRYLAHGFEKGAGSGALPVARALGHARSERAGRNRYQVVVINDDFTERAFVRDVLLSLFSKTEAEANELSTLAHNQGRAVVAELAFKKALHRVTKATRRAERAGFPLRFTIEPSEEA